MPDLIYPTADYPTIVEGAVYGDRLRLESLDGSSRVLLDGQITLDLFRQGLSYENGAFRFHNVRPLRLGDKTYGVTHLQKYSPHGYLKVEPDCYHRWYFWRPQSGDIDGNWKPGTEQGLYFRKSRVLFRTSCWRWDVAGTLIDGVLRHWIRSGGYAGGHWD